MNNERKESEQSGHGPFKDASLECISSEWKNEINEGKVSFQTKIQSTEANYMDWLWVTWLLKLSETEWDDMQIWWNGKDEGNGCVLFNITITPCVWGDKTKSQNLLSMTNILIHYL